MLTRGVVKRSHAPKQSGAVCTPVQDSKLAGGAR